MRMLEPLRPLLADFIDFAGRLVKKWFFWLFLALDVIAIIVQYVDTKFQLPRAVYVVFAVLVFMVAAFMVYRDLLIAYRNAVGSVPLPVSKLSLSFVDGNVYSCEIDSPNQRSWTESQTYEIPAAHVILNLRVENDGDVPIDIIALRAKSTTELAPAILIYHQATLVNDTPINFPLHLDPADVGLLKLRFKMGLGLLVTTAQFAADFRSIKKSCAVGIDFDTLDADGKKQHYSIGTEVASRPLVDLYVKQWREYSQKDLLRVAGYDMNS